MNNSILMDIFLKTPAYSIAESCIGNKKLKNIHEAQIALRFPISAEKPLPLEPHIDGFYYPLNDVEEGKIFSFTALAGVYLNDVNEEWAGNFTVWPGSHLLLDRYFQIHTPDPALGGRVPIDLPEPLQIKAKAGDLIFCHYLLAHAAAINISPNIRYALFFRIEHSDHDNNKISSMKNIWLEWEGFKK
jgi:ectoine hydroxylase-related dioxygenase (phytanoyl-CoA dioxygenase family)